MRNARRSIVSPGSWHSGCSWPAWRLLAIGVALAAAFGAADAFGCPTCKDAVNTSDPEGLNVARGYFYSILLMLAMPFTLAGSFGAYVWREMRRQRALEAAARSSPPGHESRPE
jgi:hypothetical protein